MNKARDSMINISCAANETMQRLCILISDGYAAQCGRVLTLPHARETAWLEIQDRTKNICLDNND